MATALATTAPADAATFTYRNASKNFEREVQAAIRAWNRSGVNVRLRRASRGRRADVRFVDHRFPRGSWTVGQYTGREIWIDQLEQRAYGQPIQRPAAYTAVHEIGHMLGLRHRDGCSVMVASHVAGSMAMDCRGSRARTTPCGPQRADVRRLARRFGWRRGGRRGVARRAFGLCRADRGPWGAPATQALCTPEALPPGSFAGLQLREFGGGGAGGQAICAWEEPGSKSGPTPTVVIDSFPPFSEGPRKLYPSGNCSGARQNTSDVLYSNSRYLTVRVVYSDRGPLPVGGWEPVLKSVLAAAEADRVGLSCASVPD